MTGLTFCADHWARLRAALDARGLSAFIATSGADAVRKMAADPTEVPAAQAFDPLVGCSVHIIGYLLEIMAKAMGPDGVSALLASGGCVLCLINEAHQHGCQDDDCTLDKVHGYDWTIDRSADDAFAAAVKHGFLGRIQ